jgi:hypothetical protein
MNKKTNRKPATNKPFAIMAGHKSEKLIPVGYIETNGKKYRATEDAYKLTNCTAYKRAGLFTQIEVILKRLNRKTL